MFNDDEHDSATCYWLVQLVPFTSKKICFELRRRHHRSPSIKEPSSTATPNDKPHATADVFADFLLLTVVIHREGQFTNI